MIFMVNSDRKKIYMTGRVSYVGGKQKMHLCLKVNKTQKKCHMNCVGGMQEGSVTTKIAWASGKLYNHWIFSTRGENGGEWRSLQKSH